MTTTDFPVLMVCGGRNYGPPGAVFAVLDHIQRERGPFARVIHGACLTGADHWADIWATSHGIAVEKHHAEWQRLGRAAGPTRNQKMIDSGPSLVVAFPGGRGTTDAVMRARAAGIEVVSALRYRLAS